MARAHRLDKRLTTVRVVSLARFAVNRRSADGRAAHDVVAWKTTATPYPSLKDLSSSLAAVDRWQLLFQFSFFSSAALTVLRRSNIIRRKKKALWLIFNRSKL
jgi:hypothetical protein